MRTYQIPKGTSVEKSWEGVLKDGEHIIWQGRPQGVLAIPKQVRVLIYFVFFPVGLLYPLGIIYNENFHDDPSTNLMIKLGFYILSIAVFAGGVWGYGRFWAWVLSRTVYSLSNKRVFIARVLPIVKTSLYAYPVKVGPFEKDMHTGLINATVGTYKFKGRHNRIHIADVQFFQLKDPDKLQNLLIKHFGK